MSNLSDIIDDFHAVFIRNLDVILLPNYPTEFFSACNKLTDLSDFDSMSFSNSYVPCFVKHSHGNLDCGIALLHQVGLC